MLHVPRTSSHLWTYNNWGTNPATTVGTSVTPGASNVEGSWTQIASSANIANDVDAFELWVHTVSGTGDRQLLLDVGVDPAGGTSYTEVIANIVVGNAPTAITAQGSGVHFVFPLHIKSGSSVAVRAQNSNATAGTLRVAAKFFGFASQPEMFPTGYISETIGAVTASSRGTSFTPGNAADGAWTSLGTTVNPLWWWQLGYSITNATITAEYTYIDLAYGDGSNKHIILTAFHGGTTAEVVSDLANSNMSFYNAYCPVPAGSTLYVRGRCNNAPDTGYNAVAIGIG